MGYMTINQGMRAIKPKIIKFNVIPPSTEILMVNYFFILAPRTSLVFKN